MISNFFILSSRGDTIITKDYRLHTTTSQSSEAKCTLPTSRLLQELFFRKVQFWDSMAHDNKSSALLAEDVNATTKSKSKEPDSNDNDNDNDSSSYSKEDAPPVFPLTPSIHALHIRRNNLLFVLLTARNPSPATCIELLSKIAKVFKDYCGTLSVSEQRSEVKSESELACL